MEKSGTIYYDGKTFYVTGYYHEGQREEGYEIISEYFELQTVTMSDSSQDITDYLTEYVIEKLEELAIEQL